jgi:hypothetical protein
LAVPSHDFAAGEVLSAANVDGYLNNSYYFFATQTVAQSIPDATFTALTFTAEVFDTDGGHTTNTKYTAQTAGRYLAQGGVTFATNATGQRYVRLAKNGTEITGSGCRVDASGNSTGIVSRTVIVHLDVGDYLEVQAHQSSGGPINTLISSDLSPSFTVWRLSS